MAWQYDAPAGVYKNHALSSKIRHQALADTVFFKYLTPEPGYGRKKGESVTLTRILRLPLANRVNETDRLPGGRPAVETKTVKISEWGYKIPMTDFERQLDGVLDLPDEMERALRRQIEETMDVMAADMFKLTPIKYVPTSAGFNLDTDGSATGVSDRNWGVSDLRSIHDYLAGDLKAPKVNGKYIGILSTQAARGLKNDPEYKDWLAPTTSQPLMDGQLKDIENFTLIETNNFGYERDALAKFAGTSTTTGEAVFFGADACGLLEIQSPEIRMGIKEDLGRFYEVGWVGILEGFHTWEKASLARVVHGTSL